MLKEIENTDTDKLANVKSILEEKGFTLLSNTYGEIHPIYVQSMVLKNRLRVI